MFDPLEVLEEMGKVLNDNRLPYEIYEKPPVEGEENSKSCQSGQSEYARVVPVANMKESVKITEAHWYKMHPEQVESDKRTSQNQCPACAADLNGNPKECPDCGLNLNATPSSHHDNCC